MCLGNCSNKFVDYAVITAKAFIYHIVGFESILMNDKDESLLALMKSEISVVVQDCLIVYRIMLMIA